MACVDAATAKASTTAKSLITLSLQSRRELAAVFAWTGDVPIAFDTRQRQLLVVGTILLVAAVVPTARSCAFKCA
jgi:hypothetical protein